MIKYVVFESDPTLINLNSGHGNYIYNPTGILNTGKTFKIKPGQKIIVIPHQPAKQGCWKPLKIEIKNGQIIESQLSELFVILIENCWLRRSITVEHGATLNWLMTYPNIIHSMVHISTDELQTVLQQWDMEDEENSEDDNNSSDIEELLNFTRNRLSKYSSKCLTNTKPTHYFGSSNAVQNNFGPAK